MNQPCSSTTVTPRPQVASSILHAARVIEDRTEAALTSIGLSMAKQSALTKLAEAGEPLTLSELAAKLSCVRSNMTQLVDRLEADGLVKRVPDAADRRVVRAELTALGRRRQVEGTRLWQNAQTELLASLSADDAERLMTLLGAVRRG